MLTIKAKMALIIRYRVIIAGICLLLMSQHVSAAALFNHIVQPYVGTALTFDNNILRLPDNFTPAMSGNRTTTSSFIKQIKAGVAAKWQISQQQLLLDASINQSWYSTFNELNYTGHSFSGLWNWHLTQKLKGEISYKNRLQLGSFAQINRLANNLVQREIYIANGAYEIFPDWYLRAGFTHAGTTYPTAQRQQSNLLENSRDIGLRYMSPLKNMLGFHVMVTDGKFPDRAASLSLDNAYTRTSYDLEGKWSYSVKTQINAQIGYVSQKYEHIKARNFSNITASADIRWDISRKSTVLLSAWRKVSASDALITNFTLNTGVMLTPVWTWSETPKILVELPISYEQRASSGTTGLDNGVISASITPRQSSRSIIRLNLDYIPTPNVEMSAFMLYENVHSSSSLHTYQDESVGLTVKVSF